MNHNFDTFEQGLAEYHVTLSDRQRDSFARFYDLLIERNQVMNLTSITEWEEVVSKHFLDSLSLLKVFKEEELSGKKLMDVGTGAGFPGIPLSILFPELQIVLLDSLQKRVNFLEDVVKDLSLLNVSVFHGRAEDFGKDPVFREQMDLTASRAVAHLSVLSEFCLPFVKVGGYFLAYKTVEMEEEIKESKNAIHVLGGELRHRENFQIPGTSLQRSILMIYKKTASPTGYPRKAGTPKKKPL